MTGSELVGRPEQLALLRDAARRADLGQAQLVVVGGEAGVGKTFLINHFAAELESAGTLVLRGDCVELAGDGLPLAPITAVLRQLTAQHGIEFVTAGIPGAEALLSLLPELGRGGPGPHSLAELFDLFTALLRWLSTGPSVLMLVDDLHHAGASTRDLLGYLTRTLREARVLVLGAYRTDELDRHHPLRPFLAELGRAPWVRRTELPPFSRAELAKLISVLRGPLPARTVDEVYRRSGGNAFFAEELIKADGGQVPESLRDLLIHQIDRLGGPTVHIVRLAAIGSQHVPHTLLTTSAGLTETELLEALRPAVDAGVLIPRDNGYTFRHALLREAVLADLLPADRARLHRIYVRALEADPALVPGERHATELAFHWDGAGEPAKALPALLRAADDAAAVFAHSEQSQLLARALDLWSHTPPAALPSGVERFDLFVSAITAALWVGECLRALDLIDRALDEIDPARQRGRAALVLAQRAMVLHELERDTALTAAAEAMELLPDDPTPNRADVLTLCSAVLGLRGCLEAARGAAEEAARIAADCGRTGTEGNARTTLGMALAQLGEHEQAIAQLGQARVLAIRHNDLIGLTRVQLNLAEALEARGEYAASCAAAQEGLDAARRAGLDRSFGAIIAGLLAQIRVAAGKLVEAEDICVTALRTDPAPSAGAMLHAARADIALILGRRHDARQQLVLARALLGAITEPVPWLSLAIARQEAELALYENRVDDAAGIVAGALSRGSAVARYLWPLLVTGARVVRRDRMRNTRTPDRALTELLPAAAAELAVDSPLAAAHAAHVAAELGGDGASWQDVIAAWETNGRPYAAAQARLRAAEATLSSGDRDAAAELLRVAGDQATLLGAEPLRHEIELLARNARLPVPSVTPAADPGDPGDELARFRLTERELDVLRLVADGRSNRQIADQLFISVKTASVHVSNILAKLGVRTRGEAATAVHRLGGVR